MEVSAHIDGLDGEVRSDFSRFFKSSGSTAVDWAIRSLWFFRSLVQ